MAAEGSAIGTPISHARALVQWEAIVADGARVGGAVSAIVILAIGTFLVGAVGAVGATRDASVLEEDIGTIA